jgi:hypothetical protein
MRRRMRTMRKTMKKILDEDRKETFDEDDENE